MIFKSILFKFKHVTKVILTYLSFESIKCQITQLVYVYYVFVALLLLTSTL